MRMPPAESEIGTGFRFPMPAPTGGWNARDNISAMKPTEALILDNWWPTPTEVEVRSGSEDEASLPDTESIRTLMGLALSDGSFKRFAASATGIWDITPGGDIAAVSSAATTSEWESINLRVAGISYLFAAAGDGVNKARIYNGSTGAWTLLDGTSTPALTGLDSTTITNLSLHGNRVIACAKDSLQFYYGALNSIAGAFTGFDLGSVFKKGGFIVATTSWSIDAGDGIDDYFVAITSEGEVAIYRGADPSTSSGFAKVGVFEVGKPTGKRCFVKLAGDVGVLTEQGLWPLSRALLSATVDKRVALTDKIQKAFNAYYSLYGTFFGWQAALLPKGPALLVNVPTSAAKSYQFVMNTMTGAWTRFNGWNASCMLVQDGKLYFALGDTVKEGWTGMKDGDSAITCLASTAFSYGPTRHRGKKINMVKPIIQATAPITFGLALDTDFAQRVALSSQTNLAALGTLWDSAQFNISIFSDGNTSMNKWKTVRHKPGGAFSLRIRLQVKDIQAQWSSTDFLGNIGNALV
jgi:hypothetical protein